MESKESQSETWIVNDSLKEERHNVEVTLGKRIDILSLKARVLSGFKSNVSNIRNQRVQLYGKKNLRKVDACPICGCSAKDSSFILAVYGAEYFQCNECSHLFVLNQLEPRDIDEFYARDETYQATYADDRTTQTRVEQVATPKARWLVRQFERIYGREPRSILDVGAGSGHFVRACTDLGIPASGVELSERGRDYCRKSFGLELLDRDFVRDWECFRDFEVITFWGVIEHVPYPMKMLNAASRILSDKDGMVVVEVPRFDSLSTIVQTPFPDYIARHLDPLGHINFFTDSSLSTAFRLSNFAMTAAWYFGMDAYELVTQLSLLLGRDEFIADMETQIPKIQMMVDLARLSDEIVLAGVPFASSEAQSPSVSGSCLVQNGIMGRY